VVEVKVRTPERITLIDITVDVNRVVAESGTREGLCNLFVPHTTASVVISENWDPDVPSDMLRQLERLVPREAGYKHAEGNSQAHILSAMLSTSINVPVHDGKLAIGRWQGVMLAEFDGPRQRSVYVTIVAA
jgi:secondary thiamine-phosphate synthase enzyme